MPAVAIGLNWKRATALAANTAIAVSLITNFAIEVFDVRIPGGIHGGTVSLLLSLTLFFAISYRFRAEAPRSRDRGGHGRLKSLPTTVEPGNGP